MALLQGCDAASDAFPASEDVRVSGGIAFVEWQFPGDEERRLEVHPVQQVVAGALDDAGKRAFFPFRSELVTEPELRDLTQHGLDVFLTYRLGRAEFEKPFLLNFSSSLPAAMEELIARGVRFFSFSSVVRGIRWAELESVIRRNPEVLVFVSTAHIAENDVPLAELSESPSALALEQTPNMVLVGCGEMYRYHGNAATEGREFGTAGNPVAIDNQPTGGLGKYHMLNCRSVEPFAPGFGGTSAAAPALATLAHHVHRQLEAKGLPLTRENLLLNLDKVMHSMTAAEKDGSIRQISVFTLDTVLANQGRELITEKIWWDSRIEPLSPVLWTR